jgi:hypothetical protein
MDIGYAQISTRDQMLDVPPDALTKPDHGFAFKLASGVYVDHRIVIEGSADLCATKGHSRRVTSLPYWSLRSVSLQSSDSFLEPVMDFTGR